MADYRKFFSLTAFQTRPDSPAFNLSWNHFFNETLSKKNIPHNTGTSIKHESFLSKFLNSKKTSSLVYKKLRSGKSESPNRSQQMWQEDITLTTKQELNWKEVYQMAF